MNAKAIALFAVLAVALTGGFVIVGADAADGDDFTAEYMTVGPLEGAKIVFDQAPFAEIEWLGSVYGDEGAIVEDMKLVFNGKETAIAWMAKPLSEGTYQVQVHDADRTIVYNGSFAVHADLTVTFYVDGEVYGEPVTVKYGKTVEEPETPSKEGSSFDGWYLSGATTLFDFTTPITEDTALNGSFKPIDYTVRIVDQSGTELSTPKTAKLGDKVEFDVTAPTGFQVKSVASSPVIGDFVFDKETYEGSFTMPASNVVVTVTFEKIDCTVTFYVDGAVYGEPVTVKYGEIAVPPKEPVKEGQKFLGWFLAGATVPYDFANTPVRQSMDVSATYEPVEYTVTVDSAIVNGTVTPDKEKAKMGDDVTLTVTPAEGYQTVSVTVDGEAIEGNTFKMPAKDVTVSATFELIPEPEYTIAVDPEIVNGTVTADKEKAKAGETVTLTVKADDGYQLVSVTVNGEPIEGTSFEMPSENVTVSATFELIPVYYDAIVKLDGEVIEDDQFVEGEAVVYDLNKYILIGVTASVTGPEDVEFDFTDGILSFEMPAKDVDFELVLTPIVLEYTITVDSEIEGGDVLPDTILAAEGATVTLSYTEDEGYTFVSYYAYTESTETPITVSDDGKFTMPAEDVIVGAYFLPDVPVEKYTVTVLPSENGTASADVTEAEEGDLITITATPDDGYQTVAIYVDGQPLLEGENTFLMPAKNVEVSAVFAEIPVGGSTVTYVDVNGVIETVSYEIGQEVVYHVTTVPEGMKLGYVDFEPWMAFIISQEDCTVEFTAAEGNYTATISYIAPFTVTILNQDGEKIGGGEYFAEDPVKLDIGYTLGVEVESATSEPEIDDFNCEDGVITFTMPAQDVTVTVTLKPIVPETVKVVFIDGITEEEVATKTVIVGAYLTEIPNEPVHEGMTFTGWYREGSDVPYDFETMPVMENMTVYAQYEEGPITDKVTVTFYDITGEEVLGVASVDAGTLVPADEIPEAPSIEGMNFRGWMTEDQVLFDFETEAVEDDMDVYAFYLPEPVMMVSVTFMDGETVIDTVYVEIGGFVEEVPEAPVKEGFNFVGWCVNDIPTAIDFSELPIIDDMVVVATYVETPDIGEGFAILYHDMYQGKPVDIWWKGYASKDDRVMLANGMDATAIFMGWLAEDQETLFSWNAAYDLNDIERNDCLIYPASYGYPGTDRIYELNAIYALEIEWVSFDGETVLKTDEVIRGDYLDAPFDDEEMQEKLDDYKPSDEGYSYTWAGWNVPGVGTYTSEDVEYIKANGSWRIVATYEGKVNEYDITFNWHDGTSTIRVPYGDTPEIENPPAYEDDNFTYTFAGWDPEVTEVTGDATYTATYDKTSKTKDVTITVNDPVRGYFTYGDEELTEKVIEVPMDFDVADIDEDVLTFDLLFYVLDVEIPETLVFTAVTNDDDYDANKHYEFVEWTVSEDGSTYTAVFTEDIITSKDLDRIQTFFDYTKTEGGDVVFTLKSKDGLAIPKGTMTVWYYEIAYLEDIEDWVQIERSCDAIAMDWDEETYGDNLISMTIEYADLTQDGEAFDITSKTISTMWLVFDGVNGAHCESNKATPGQ